MLKPKSSAIVIKTLEELKKIASSDWNAHGAPFKPLFYMSYRAHGGLLFSVIVAYDCNGKLRTLPWHRSGTDMRPGLTERKLEPDKPDRTKKPIRRR